MEAEERSFALKDTTCWLLLPLLKILNKHLLAGIKGGGWAGEGFQALTQLFLIQTGSAFIQYSNKDLSEVKMLCQ